MTKGMIVEVHVQFMVDYPGTVFEGVGAYKFPVFPDTSEIHALQGAANATFNWDNPINGISFFIILWFQIMICVIFAIEKPVLFLCDKSML